MEVLRRAWPEILQTLTKIKRSTWALVEPNAQVGHFEDHVLTLAFTTTGLAGAFGRADHAENLRQAIHKTIGIDCQIRAVAGSSNSPASSEPNPKAPPASPETPASSASQATSADVAWGLSPAPQQAPSPANDAAEAVPSRVAPAHVPAASTPSTQPTPAPAAQAQVRAAAAGSGTAGACPRGPSPGPRSRASSRIGRPFGAFRVLRRRR